MYLLFSVIAIFYLSTFSIVNAQNSKSSDCNTPNGTAGNCINIRQCKPLIKMLQERPLLPESVNYLRQSQCGFEATNPSVCCPAESVLENITLKNVDNNDPIISLLDNPLLPRECGRDSIPRDLEAAHTDLDEFPWMVLLEYDNGKKKVYDCTGFLITKRYVLTAAHCFNDYVGILSNVRLGEYNLSSAKDCVKRDDVVTCSDDPITVEIEERIPHELYVPRSDNNEYDIGLLRLSRDIVSTNYVKPICLPRSPMVNKRLYVTGWGETLTSFRSDVKLKVSLPFFDKEDCVRIHKMSANITLTFEQICAGGEKNKGACRGDSGAPLMAFQNLPNGDKIWTAVGIVSFNIKPCGTNWPTVFHKVYDFIPWIISKIRP